MTPETLRAWQRVIRDFVMIVVGTFMIVFGVLTIREPTVLTVVLGAGLGMFGLPPVLRFDESRRNTPEDK
jgi:hypothetical protein